MKNSNLSKKIVKLKCTLYDADDLLIFLQRTYSFLIVFHDTQFHAILQFLLVPDPWKRCPDWNLSCPWLHLWNRSKWSDQACLLLCNNFLLERIWKIHFGTEIHFGAKRTLWLGYLEGSWVLRILWIGVVQQTSWHIPRKKFRQNVWKVAWSRNQPCGKELQFNEFSKTI